MGVTDERPSVTPAPTSDSPDYDDDDDEPSDHSIIGLIERDPILGSIMLITTISCGFTVFCLAYRQIKLYRRKTAPSDLRRYYIVICSFPSMEAAYCILAVTFPGLSMFFEVLTRYIVTTREIHFKFLVSGHSDGFTRYPKQGLPRRVQRVCSKLGCSAVAYACCFRSDSRSFVRELKICE